MGNLGLYPTMTKAAKRVGGPLVLLAGTAISGWVVGRGAEVGVKDIVKRVKTARRRRQDLVRNEDAAPRFVVSSEADCGGGLVLHVGDEFRVLSQDGDAVLVEVIDAADNPYFVSAELLVQISDYHDEATE